MSWYELLLTLHILAAALYLGSVLAITMMSFRALASDPPTFGPVINHAGWWASKAHPAAATVILVAGILMVLDADLSFGDAWISIGLGGWLLTGLVGGALAGPAAVKMGEAMGERGGYSAELRPLASRFLLFSRIEAALLVAIIAVMVTKPGA